VRIGIHTSIAGSLERAASTAAAMGANTLQIFSSSPRMWRGSTHGEQSIDALKRARAKHDLYPLVIHDNYLINMASCDEGLRGKSIAAFRGEIERALAIDAEYIVAHPGNCRDHSVEMGIHMFATALGEAARGIDTRGLTLLIENTAGAGTALGSRFEELAVMKMHAANYTGLNIGFCIDTCHCLAAGYDLSTKTGWNETMIRLEAILGLDNIHVFHANDSKAPLASHIDRHEHIGRGYIGMEGFRRILTHPKLRRKAFIAETPVDEEGDDRRNVQTLISLCRKSRTTTKKSS
jgi:deoxyribonuclease IV